MCVCTQCFPITIAKSTSKPSALASSLGFKGGRLQWTGKDWGIAGSREVEQEISRTAVLAFCKKNDGNPHVLLSLFIAH